MKKRKRNAEKRVNINGAWRVEVEGLRKLGISKGIEMVQSSYGEEE